MVCTKPTKWSLVIAVMVGIAANGTVRAYGGPAGAYGMVYSDSGPRYRSDNQPLHTNLNHFGNVPVSSTIGLMNAASSLRDRGEIVLYNASENSHEAKYSLNGRPYVMKPGAMQRLKNDRVWHVEVNTETGQVVRYTLGSGVYKFKSTGMSMSCVALVCEIFQKFNRCTRNIRIAD